MLVAYRPLSLRNDLRMSGELGAQPDPNLTFEREHPFCLNRSSTAVAETEHEVPAWSGRWLRSHP